MCEDIYIGNTQQTTKKIMDGHFPDILRLIKNVQKPDSFASYLEQYFNATKPHTYIRKYMTFKVVKIYKPDWRKVFFHENQLQLMYGGTFNGPKIYT